MDTPKMLRNRPWFWVPTLYFAEGLPYIAVMTLSVVMYKNLGLDNTSIALYTGWLYLPWVVKPLWSPIVDIFSTRRRWTIAMEALLAVAFGCVAFALRAPAMLQCTLAAFGFMAFLSATHDIAADGYYMLALDTREQSLFVGIRSTFYRIATVVGQGALVVVAGSVTTATGSVHTAWMVVMGTVSTFFALVALWHHLVMPRPRADREADTGASRQIGTVLKAFGTTFISFFRKPHALTAIIFILLYRLPEAQLVKLINPFLLDPVEAGGMGLSTTEVGLVYGTIGIGALTLGGIVGGIIVAAYGLRRCLMPMAWTMSLTCLTFLYLSFDTAAPMWLICACVLVEQLGYGIGFTAFTLSLIKFSEGPAATTHYALCTGFMALGMMLPGMAAGAIADALGYRGFFICTMICCIATIGAALMVKRKMNHLL